MAALTASSLGRKCSPGVSKREGRHDDMTASFLGSFRLLDRTRGPTWLVHQHSKPRTTAFYYPSW